jgi:hypothetical protein
MNKLTIGLLAVLALGLAGFTGCDGEKSAAPNSEDRAWCKTNYTTKDACDADVRCQWKLADESKGTKDRCVGK